MTARVVTLPAAAAPLVEVDRLRKRYGSVEALKGVSFGVRAGEIFGLLGPNGAGKSTTINILCGLVPPDAGSARLDGHDVIRQGVEARRSLGVVPQEVALYDELNAAENLHFFGRLYGLSGVDLKQRIARMLERVSLADRAKDQVSKYSGGMKRRLNIAAGVLHGPKVVLMDEPTVGLDPQTRASILTFVRSIAAEGVAVIYTTHYLDEAERLCDRLAIIDQGALLAEGTLAELRRAAGEREIVALRGVFSPEAATAALATFGDVHLIKATDSELLFSLQSAERELPSLLALGSTLGQVREVAMKQPSLENLFIKLTGRELRE